VGTTVVRALEGNALVNRGRLRAGLGTTDLVIGSGFVPHVVDGLLSGVHEPGTSHYRVVSAFGPQVVIDQAHEHAAAKSLLIHEFGDATLVMPGVAVAADAAA
jgi:S-adenosylmethionine:tRNA ribosyltransferase-isomerase